MNECDYPAQRWTAVLLHTRHWRISVLKKKHLGTPKLSLFLELPSSHLSTLGLTSDPEFSTHTQISSSSSSNSRKRLSDDGMGSRGTRWKTPSPMWQRITWRQRSANEGADDVVMCDKMSLNRSTSQQLASIRQQLRWTKSGFCQKKTPEKILSSLFKSPFQRQCGEHLITV